MIDYRTRERSRARACTTRARITRHISPHPRNIRNTTAEHFLSPRASSRGLTTLTGIRASRLA